MNNKIHCGPASLLDRIDELDIGWKKFFKYEYLIFYEESKNNEREVEEYCLNKKMIQTMKAMNPKVESYECREDRESEWMNDDMEDYGIDQGDEDEINDYHYKMMMDEMEKEIQNEINNDIMHPKRLNGISSKEEEEEDEEEEEEEEAEDDDGWEDLDEEVAIVDDKRSEENEDDNEEEDYVNDDEEYE